MKQSEYGKLNMHDLAKGGIVALLTAAITSLLQTFESGRLPNKEQLIAALIAGISAAMAYLIKNMGTNNQDEFLKKNVVHADAAVTEPTPAPGTPTPPTSQPSNSPGGDTPPVPPIKP